MGCASSANDASDTKTVVNGNAKGGKAGADTDGGDQAAPKQNPYLSLVQKDIFSLKMSFKGVRRSLEETGVYMFTKMFQANPDLKNYFDKLKNLNDEALYKSDALLNHATKVMEAIDTAITELDDAEKTHQGLKKLGQQHKKREVPDSVIKEMRDPFLKSIENTLGDRYSDRMRTIYEIFIDYVIKTIIEGYNS